MFVEVLTQISAKAVDQYYVYKVPKVFRDKILRLVLELEYLLVRWN